MSAVDSYRCDSIDSASMPDSASPRNPDIGMGTIDSNRTNGAKGDSPAVKLAGYLEFKTQDIAEDRIRLLCLLHAWGVNSKCEIHRLVLRVYLILS